MQCWEEILTSFHTWRVNFLCTEFPFPFLLHLLGLTEIVLIEKFLSFRFLRVVRKEKRENSIMP